MIFEGGGVKLRLKPLAVPHTHTQKEQTPRRFRGVNNWNTRGIEGDAGGEEVVSPPFPPPADVSLLSFILAARQQNDEFDIRRKYFKNVPRTTGVPTYGTPGSVAD